MMRWLLIIFLFLVSCSANTDSAEQGGLQSIYVSNSGIEIDTNLAYLYGKPGLGKHANISFDFSASPYFCFDPPSPEYLQKGFEDPTSMSCSGGYYKLLDNKDYVLHFPANVDLDYGECLEMQIDSGSTEGVAELLTYEKGKANLSNLCGGCVVMTEFNGKMVHFPKKSLYVCEGKVFIGKSGLLDHTLGKHKPRLTFFIPRLTFFDIATNEEIVIKNQWIWQVPESN